MGNPQYTSLPSELSAQDVLTQLALNIRWSWNHRTDEIWRRLDPELWELTHNPWVVLQAVSRETLDRVRSDPAFQELVAELGNEAGGAPRWFETKQPVPLKSIAYFSMEYMLSEALPIYSGGLGNVAGDQLKAADDLAVPVVAIGLLYQRGYFRQSIGSDGSQIALYPFNDPSQLPILPLRDEKGNWLRIAVRLPGFTIWIRTWEVRVGRRSLYLLDTNDPANHPEYRCITSELYGGGARARLRQEQVLGIGGTRLLHALGIQAETFHLNEGHAAFAVLERAAYYMEETGKPFDIALSVTRPGNLFTTHTPVEAGFDRFSPELIAYHFRRYAPERLHISIDELLALGRKNPSDGNEPFNMAYLALRGSGAVNGVSRLHAEVSRKLFAPMFPGWPLHEVPVGYVTNGVHTPTWDSPEADKLWTETCGKHRWRGGLEQMQSCIRHLDDHSVWNIRNDARKSLVTLVRERYARQLAIQGASPVEISAAKNVLNPDTLTLAFARRFAPYKRPTLLLHDAARFRSILTNSARPVQILVAGKAHPEDAIGQGMIRQWNRFIEDFQVQSQVVFLADYDMLLTEELVAGADVWLNTPRRPWEASGTSGMKVLVNGGLNLSELDGWWAEAYSPEVGWAIGDGHDHGDDPAWDAAEANSLYALLEHEVAPAFYRRDSGGIPIGWIQRVRESMARLTPAFSANRVVREYTDNHYIPSADAYARRAADGGRLGQEIRSWEVKVAAAWPQVHFGELRVTAPSNLLCFEVKVYLGDLEPEMVRVELYAEPGFRQIMDPGHRTEDGGYLYSAAAPVGRDANDYTPRVFPYHPGAIIPLEGNYIRWQK